MTSWAIDKIRDLYGRNPESKRNDRFLDKLERDPPRDFSLGILDAYKHGSLLSIVLANLPPEEVFYELGKYVFLWTFLRYPYDNQTSEELHKTVGRITNRNPQILENARLSAKQLLDREDAATVLVIDDMIEKLQAYVDSVDLLGLLVNCAKENVTLSYGRISDYQLLPAFTKNGLIGYERTFGRSITNGGSFDLYLDAPAGIILMYRGQPNAVVGFVPSDPQTLMIYQLQGIQLHKVDEGSGVTGKKSSRGLAPIYWQRLLVECSAYIARELDLERIGILGGYNNMWTHPYRGVVHLPLDVALTKYDDVAERLGFRQKSDRNWYKRI